MTEPSATTQSPLELSSPCSSPPCTPSTMMPGLSPSSALDTPVPPLGPLPLNPDELERQEFYNTYNAWTGINIAASLGGFFLLLILMLLYKSQCKRRSKYPPCPSAEDGEGSLLETWESPFPGSSLADGISLRSIRHFSLESTPIGTARSSRHSLATARSSRPSLTGGVCACSAPGSVQRLWKRGRLSSGGSSSDTGHQLQLRVHHPGSAAGRRGPPRYAFSFDEKASVPESWWQRVDINVIQPTPSVTPSQSMHCLTDIGMGGDQAPTPPLSVPRLDLPVPRLDLPRARRGSVISSSDLTDFDSRSIGSDSVFLADDDWSSCSDVPVTPRGARRRSPLSRQASICLDDDALPPDCPLPAATSRTELVFAPGVEASALRAERPEGGGTRRSPSPQFLTVPQVHNGPRSPPVPRRSPNFLCPPSPTYGASRSMSPPPPPSPGLSSVGAGRRLGALGRQVSVCRSGSSSSSSSSASSLPRGRPAASSPYTARRQFAAGCAGRSLDLCSAPVLPPGERSRKLLLTGGAGRSLDLGGGIEGDGDASSGSSSNLNTLTASEELTVSVPCISSDGTREVIVECHDTESKTDSQPVESLTLPIKVNGADDSDCAQLTLEVPQLSTSDSCPIPEGPLAKQESLNDSLLVSPSECSISVEFSTLGPDVESSGAESADTPL